MGWTFVQFGAGKIGRSLAGALFLGFSGASLEAQNTLVNPYFSTGDFLGWNKTPDTTLKAVPGNASMGMEWYCARKSPGTPTENGNISQDVALIAGQVYDFSANIAAAYICPG